MIQLELVKFESPGVSDLSLLENFVSDESRQHLFLSGIYSYWLDRLVQAWQTANLKVLQGIALSADGHYPKQLWGLVADFMTLDDTPLWIPEGACDVHLCEPRDPVSLKLRQAPLSIQEQFTCSRCHIVAHGAFAPYFVGWPSYKICAKCAIYAWTRK